MRELVYRNKLLRRSEVFLINPISTNNSNNISIFVGQLSVVILLVANVSAASCLFTPIVYDSKGDNLHEADFNNIGTIDRSK